MKCSDTAELAPLYIAGELSAKRAAAFDSHLRTCPACLRELQEQAQLDAQLRRALLAEEPDVANLNRRVRERIEAEASDSKQSIMRLRRRRLVIVASGAAAALLLSAIGYRLLLSPRVASVYAAAATDHRLEVVEQRPRPWFVDPARIASLAEREGVPGSAPFALDSSGYHLERARVCWLDGRFFLHVVYSNGGQEFSVYLRQRDGQRPAGRFRETANGRSLYTSKFGQENVASFETDRLMAMVVTDQSTDAALSFARFAASAL
ncbi:MAG TPA: anti-sigma factor [Candidatus Acidoferrales bacterium]|nr:anti-sigma factor [Candidatus Acidoferrales bacterium]